MNVNVNVMIPGEEDALHHVEVLHQHVPLGLGAQVAHGVVDAQHDGPFQGGRRGLMGGSGVMGGRESVSLQLTSRRVSPLFSKIHRFTQILSSERVSTFVN